MQDGENWLGSDDEPLTGFSWRGGSEPETTGIQLWSEVFPITRSDGTEVHALFLFTYVLYVCRRVVGCSKIKNKVLINYFGYCLISASSKFIPYFPLMEVLSCNYTLIY